MDVITLGLANSRLNAKAGALIDTAGGATVTIAPDKTLSNPIRSLILQGKTVQAGTGTPSASNIRPVSGVGQYDARVALTGNEEILLVDGGARISVRAKDNANAEIVAGTSATIAASRCTTRKVVYQTAVQPGQVGAATWSNRLYLYFATAEFESVAAVKAYLAALAAAGTPLTVWYKSTAYATAATYYTVTEVTDSDGYRAYGCALPDAPLFDGDSTDLVSGRVLHQMAWARLTGSEAVTLVDSDTHWAVIIARNANAAIAPGQADGILAYSICDQRQMVTPGLSGAGKLGIAQWSGVLYVYFATSEFATADAVKAHLTAQYAAGTPVTVVYKLVGTTETVGTPQYIHNAASSVTIAAENTAQVTYAPDIKTYIDNKLAALTALTLEA